MTSRHGVSMLIDFIDSLPAELSEDRFWIRFSEYLQEKFAAQSFALAAHDQTPWPFRILSAGARAEQVQVVLSGWHPSRRKQIKNNTFSRIGEWYIYPFHDRPRGIAYVLLVSRADSASRKKIADLCGSVQGLSLQLRRAGQFSAGQIQKKYQAYLNNLTHDFNTLLTLISMLNLEQEDVRQKLNYGRKLIRDFLFFLSQPEIIKTAVDIQELIAAVLPNFARRVTVRNSLPPGVKRVRLRLDVELISKALTAVLDNAVYFAGLQNGNVRIEISRVRNYSPFIEHDWLALGIADEGPPIPAEFLERVREPFFTTLKDQGKAGLGLALADKIVQLNGGCLTLSNSGHDGVQVVMYLPWEEEHD